MGRQSIFDAVKAARGKPWTGSDIAILDAALDSLGVPRDRSAVPTALHDAEAFYKAIRVPGGLFAGGLSQEQVDGLGALLVAMGSASWPIAFAANGLATAYLETNKTMQPVAEAYYLGAKAEAWRRANLRYWPYYGRGYPQTTWEKNYQRADDALGLGGKLMANLDLMLTPEVAAPTMVRGMSEGWFTGKKLADYLPASGPGKAEQHKEARRIINGTDRWADLAAFAMKFQAALESGRWS